MRALYLVLLACSSPSTPKAVSPDLNCPSVTVLARDENGPAAATLTQDSVVWVGGPPPGTYKGPIDAHIRQVPRAGGAVTELALLHGSNRIAADDTAVYTTNCGQACSLVSVALVGGKVTTLVEPVVESAPFALTADSVVVSASAGIVSVPKLGGAATVLHTFTSGLPLVAVVADTLYFSERVSADAYTLNRMPLAGGTVEKLADTAQIDSLVADDKRVVWVEYANGLYSISTWPLPAGPAKVVASPLVGAFPIALDADNVFFGQGTGSDVKARGLYRVAVAGGAPARIDCGMIAPIGLAMDATTLFFTDRQTPTGAVFQMPKP